MSLDLTSAFTEKTILKENWIFKLYYDDESQADFFGVSYYDTVVEDIDYKGCVLNKATIRESISLENSTANTSNVSLTLANFIDNTGNRFSIRLFNGSNKYINRKVQILIQPDDAIAEDDCVLIYTGRLEQISHDQEKINLSIVAQRPWDKISIPSTKTSTSDNDNIYFPISYGNFTANSTGVGTGKDLRPIPFVQQMHDGKVFATNIQSKSGSSQAHLYNKNKDVFLVVSDTENNNISKLGGYVTEIRENGARFIIMRPFEARDSDSGTPYNGENSGSVFSNEERAIDGSSSTYATRGFAPSSSETLSTNMYLNMPKLDFGSIVDISTSMKVFVSYKIENYSGSGNVRFFVKFEGDAVGVNDNSDAVLISTHTANTDVTAEGRIFVDTSSYPSYILIKVKSSVDCDVSISDIYLQVKFKDSDETFKNIDMAYTGEDGLISSIDGSSITQIHQAHYDLLRRFTSYGSVPTNYSTLNSARDWGIRYWILESTSLIDVLEKLQFEGGFIGRFNGQGNFQYIFIPSSPSASVTLGKNDTSDIKISLTPINGLTTKMDIEYEKHPAESKYLSSATSVSDSDANLLSSYNIASDENVKRITLDAYVSPTINEDRGNASNKNDCFYRYYDHILGQPRLILNLTIINPKYLGLDVGDIVAYSDNDLIPFAGSTGWEDYVFMITDVSRSVGSLKITLREI
jgi:hypothetical protein